MLVQMTTRNHRIEAIILFLHTKLESIMKMNFGLENLGWVQMTTRLHAPQYGTAIDMEFYVTMAIKHLEILRGSLFKKKTPKILQQHLDTSIGSNKDA